MEISRWLIVRKANFLTLVSEPKFEKSRISLGHMVVGKPVNISGRSHKLCVAGELNSRPEERLPGDHMGCL